MKPVRLPTGKVIRMYAYLNAHPADVPNMHSAQADFNRIWI